MAYSIREAAEAAGVSKSTIQRRLKEGDISRNADGKIDPSELARVYPDSVKVSLDHGQNTVSGTP
jgi:DNA-binding Lrp family transcriptional regulator